MPRHFLPKIIVSLVVATLPCGAAGAFGQIVRLPSSPPRQTAAAQYVAATVSVQQPSASSVSSFQAFDTVEVHEAIAPPLASDQDAIFPQSTTARSSPSLPPGAKAGMLQRLTFTETWLASGGDDGLGVNTLELSAILAAPIFATQPPFLITPRFAAHFLDGPITSDLPARVFDTSLEFRWLRPLNDRWTADLAVAPGFYSDFDNTSSDAIRITGRAVGIYKWTPTLTVALGIVYLDREDVSLLPVFGLIWKPDDTLNVELLFPRPKVAKRIVFGLDASWWTYVAGEFGGGSWAIQRASGADDVATVRDFRAILGLQRKANSGGSMRFEVAYVFGRQLEYLSATPDLSLDDTVLVRAGASY